MIRFDDRGLEIKSEDAVAEISFMIALLKKIIPKEEFTLAIVTALCSDIPDDCPAYRKQDENVTKILKEMEKRRAQKNKGNKHS